jgi:DNA invertase Pin-like site-specific DNA recombinase
MKNCVFGYMRVSTEARNLGRQLNTPKKMALRDIQ